MMPAARLIADFHHLAIFHAGPAKSTGSRSSRIAEKIIVWMFKEGYIISLT